MNRRFLLRASAALALAGVLASCAAPAPSAVSPASAGRPRLVVLFVVDGLPVRQVEEVRHQLAPDGLARFLQHGAVYAQARYGHAFTVTAAGHATLLTGASPRRTGIVGNDWIARDSGRSMYCTADPEAQYIDSPTQPGDGTSPRNLKVETVGDVLRRRDARAKVIGISGKDRGAILPAGHAGTAYMYMARTGRFASSTFYTPRHPAWVETFNAGKPADRYFRAEWKPLLPEAAYASSIPDNQPWYGPRGGQLPMTLGAADAAPGPGFHAALLRSPFIDALTLDFARAALAGERLGQDEVPDILSVSLSGHDYVNHQWSAESRLSHDHLLQLDRLLQAFFADLDRTVGRDRYVAVLTADHGFMPAPEVNRARGLDTGRISGGQLLAAVNAALAERFGEPKLVPATSASALVLDRERIAARGLDFDTVAAAARDAVLRVPGIAAAATRQELAGAPPSGAPLFDAMRRSWNPQVSGDVQYTVKRNWMFGNAVATHGSPYEYDNHVPLLLWGPRWVQAGTVDTPVDMTALAPTLAKLLALPPPAASEGRPLPLAGR